MKIKSALRSFEASLGDAILGISTLGSRKGDYPETKSMHDDSFWYESKSYYLNWLYLRPVRLTAQDVVYDIGCGAGRLLFVAALIGVKRGVGLELSERLSELARTNASKLRWSHPPIEIRQADASQVDYSEGTVFLMCNPFGARTLETVLDQIRSSLTTNPRQIRLMYIHPEPDHLALFAKCDWLDKTGERTFPGAWGIPALYFRAGP
ncbi:MAG: class I SAM-dependent methyltransferase [Verrucomicrobiota bacterium]